MKVIGVGGQLAQGKDEISNYLANRLAELYGEVWHRIGFAHAVKQVFMDTFDVTWDFIEEWKRKPEPPPGFDMPVRQALQFIGDGFRGIQRDIWVQTAFRDENPKIISDLRYLSEAVAIRQHGGFNVLVWRKNYENDDPNPSESQIKPIVDWFVRWGQEGDVSMLRRGCYFGSPIPEDVKLFDFFLRNEGDLNQLYEKVDEMLIPAIEGHYEYK